MTIEDDFLSIIQGVLLIAGPILFLRTTNLWSGILEGGLAEIQAEIAFTTDPVTVLSVVACLAAVLSFCIYAIISGKQRQSSSSC